MRPLDPPSSSSSRSSWLSHAVPRHALLAALALVPACPLPAPHDSLDAGAPPDAPPDDAGAPRDAGSDATDGGPTRDAGSAPPDGGIAPDDDAGPDGGSDDGFPAGTSAQILLVDGVTRTFTLHVPVELDHAPAALVLVLHGGGGSGAGAATDGSSALSVFRTVADRDGLVVAYPDGLASDDAAGRAGWADCRGDSEVQGDADDVAFLAALTASLRTAFDVPADHVFVAGTSNGALMTFAMVKQRPELFRAVATSSGNLPALPRPGACEGPFPTPVPILLTHGTADTFMPYDGGCVVVTGAEGQCPRGSVVSAVETVAAFRALNGASADAVVTSVDVATDDGSAALRHVYGGVAPVEWWQLTGAGHPAPSMSADPPSAAAGPQNRDVEFAELAWDFFRRQLAPVEPPAQDAGTPDEDEAPPVGLSVDLELPEHPGRRFDAYVPSAPQRVVVFLHGGGGTKEAIANNLGLNALPPAELDDLGVVWLLPQGAALPGAPATWSNHVMTSGQDDVALLGALAAYAGQRWPGAQTVLAGHSNGGMMTHRLWCEANAAFDRYVSVAGPPSVLFDVDAGSAGCAGTRPYWAIVGNVDRVLQTEGNGLADTWEINPELVANSPDAFLDATLINERRAHRTLRAPSVCPGATLVEPVDLPDATAPRLREWADCDGRARLWWVFAQRGYLQAGLGNHTIAALESDGDFVLRERLSSLD